MKKQFGDFRTLLSTFSYDEQIYLINQIIYEFASNKKQHRNILDRRYDQLKELKHIKSNIIKTNKLIN